MKKIILTIIVVSTLLLSTAVMSLAAPEDIPGTYGPTATVHGQAFY